MTTKTTTNRIQRCADSLATYQRARANRCNPEAQDRERARLAAPPFNRSADYIEREIARQLRHADGQVKAAATCLQKALSASQAVQP